MNVLDSIIYELIKSKANTLDDLAKIKRKASKIHKAVLPSNINLLKRYHELLKKRRIKKSEQIELLLRTRPIRSLSGIVNISVLTKPYPCPGKCLYCPTESGIPKSYVSGEPAVERAKTLGFNPYLQVKKRIEMLENEGHPTDKIELRIVGGTWSFYPKNYQEWFIIKCFEACNNFVTQKISKSEFLISKQIRNSNLKILKKEQKKNERAKHKVIGLSIETRPDFIDENEIKKLREYGATMVELGVQSIYDDVLNLNLRGNGRKEIISATKLLKDAGFKVLYQMMPNLPGSTPKRDEKMLKELFLNPNFQPDMLKIYPCALLKEAPLYKLWKTGKYKPYTKPELIKLIKTIKKNIPYYVRIQRITRDIPSKSIISGPAKISNLRQMLSENMVKENWRCKCIRCREVKENYNQKEKVLLLRQDYEASGGKEIFLSFENKNRTKLYSLLRLRINSTGRAIIREIHTYGQLLPISFIGGRSSDKAPQHQGLGKKLVMEAEKIVCAEFNRGAKKESASRRIAIIAGVGVRGYFRKLGYKLENTYMVKDLK